ncbi:Filament-like plant protein 4 [Camellia lanceoleosa]|uniref:Filament-like plant protein 4 n=1 Tax=Camellia lanceoleosa TaxID=1840588 RepID=A0ACC0GVN9_9ERIC|nr:Filament-like plant protein 4 [Camellia lanceoleosa]
MRETPTFQGLYCSGCDLVVFRERKEEEEGDGEEEMVGLVVFIDRKEEGDGEEEVSVEIGDLKPDPALWHEDNGREPWENRRQDHPGSISGWHLGDVAHRLVANSLQLRANWNGYSSEEKNMCVRSTEVANKQHLEGVKKIAKLEAECQRLRGLVRKKLPGPAALAQMKLEVENLGRDYGETRVRRSLLKPPSPHPPQLPDFSLDSVPKFYKENDFLTECLLAMEEETKSLQIPTEGSLSQNAISPPSLSSMSEDGNDNERSCTGCWATTAISELSHFKGKNIEKSNKAENENHLELMDGFLEMEKLASNDSNGAISGSAISNNIRSEMANQDTTINPHFRFKEQPELDSLANHESNAELPVPDPQSDIDPLPLMKFQMKHRIACITTPWVVFSWKVTALMPLVIGRLALRGLNELHFNVLGYKNNEAETNCSYCIYEVALPENKVVQDTSGDRYSNGCAHFSDSTSDPDIPHEGSFISTFESNATSWKCLLEEFEQLKLEKDNMVLDLESTKAHDVT